MKLSFCVPVYNRAESLATCLKSLVGQTLAADDYEVIVVDDGSTDGSADVAERVFAESQFGHGRVIRLPENTGGASTPRNVAVEHASGDYLFFVDSDDYVAPELAERVCVYAGENSSDLVYVKYGVVGEGLIPPKVFSSRGSLPQADIIENGLLYATMVHKGFRRSEWLRLGLGFDPGVRVYEDMLVTVRFLFGTSRVSVLADQEYYFFVNHGDDRLHHAEQSLECTFGLYADVLDAIMASDLGDDSFRSHCAAIIINRIAQHGPASGHPYLSRSLPKAEARRWMGLWRGLLAGHLPLDADRFLAPKLYNEIRSLRRGNLTAARIAVWIEDIRPAHPTPSRILRRLFRTITTIMWK